MRLWYKQEADDWLKALPLGNGHMGAMAFGGDRGVYELSENTCWSGGQQEKYIQEHAKEYMKKGRALLLEGKIKEAEEILALCCGIKENYGTQPPICISKR